MYAAMLSNNTLITTVILVPKALLSKSSTHEAENAKDEWTQDDPCTSFLIDQKETQIRTTKKLAQRYRIITPNAESSLPSQLFAQH